jgi:hypothetical protein
MGNTCKIAFQRKGIFINTANDKLSKMTRNLSTRQTTELQVTEISASPLKFLPEMVSDHRKIASTATVAYAAVSIVAE